MANGSIRFLAYDSMKWRLNMLCLVTTFSLRTLKRAIERFVQQSQGFRTLCKNTNEWLLDSEDGLLLYRGNFRWKSAGMLRVHLGVGASQSLKHE